MGRYYPPNTPKDAVARRNKKGKIVFGPDTTPAAVRNSRYYAAHRNASHGNQRSGPTHSESIASRGIHDIHETPQYRAQTTARPKRPTVRPARDVQSIINAVLAAAQAPQGGATGYAIDIGSVTKPYDEAIAASRSQAEANKVKLQQLQATSLENANQYGRDTSAAVGRQQAAQQAAARAAMVEAQNQGKRTQSELAAQGVDPIFAAQAKAESANNVQQRGAANQAVAADLGTSKDIAAADARSRQQDATDIGNLSQQNLQQNLLSAVLGLNTEKAGAKAQAEQANAQSAADAANQNAQTRAQFMQQLAGIITGVQQAATDAQGDPTAYETPGRANVQNFLDTYDQRAGAQGKADDAIRYATQADNEDDAKKQLDQYISDLNKEYAANDPNFKVTHPNGINFNKDYLREILHNYYRTSRQLRQSKYDELMQAAQLQAGLLGLGQ